MVPRDNFIKIEKPIDSARLTFMKFRLVRDRSALLHFLKRAFAAFACRNIEKTILHTIIDLNGIFAYSISAYDRLSIS